MNANKTMRMHIFWTLLAKICLEFEQRLVLDFFFFTLMVCVISIDKRLC